MACRPRLVLCTSLIYVLVLPSCFTMLLWGHGPRAQEDGYVEASARPEKAEGMPIPLRIFLTPFTVVLDICTLPFQLEVWDALTEDDDGC